MLAIFLRTAALFIMIITVTLSAMGHAADNLSYEKRVTAHTIDNLLRYKVLNGHSVEKNVSGRTGILGGHITATAEYPDEHGGICTVKIEKELLFLGYPGDYKLSRRCHMKGKKDKTV